MLLRVDLKVSDIIIGLPTVEEHVKKHSIALIFKIQKSKKSALRKKCIKYFAILGAM